MLINQVIWYYFDHTDVCDKLYSANRWLKKPNPDTHAHWDAQWEIPISKLGQFQTLYKPRVTLGDYRQNHFYLMKHCNYSYHRLCSFYSIPIPRGKCVLVPDSFRALIILLIIYLRSILRHCFHDSSIPFISISNLHTLMLLYYMLMNAY